MISRELALSERSVSSLISELHTLYLTHPSGLSLVQRLKAEDLEIEIEEAIEWDNQISGRW